MKIKSSIAHGLSIGLAAAALAVASLAQAAAPAVDRTAIEKRYQKERAACVNGASHQDRQTCLKEAVNARAEALKRPASSDAEDWQRNALARCERVPADERTACEKLAMGEGKTSGSVEGGGVIKEIVTRSVGDPIVIVPVKPAR